MNVKEWLGENNQIGLDIWHKKYQYDGESFDEWLDRVSGGNETVKNLIESKKFLFAGRILSNRGLNKLGKKVTYSNCYVMQQPDDNIESIFDCARGLARTFSYGGGCGIDISKLSPKGAIVNNAAKETSGAISFMDLYSMTTELIGQAGRRGALMISLDCHHPDIEDFITIKSDLDKVTKANISIRVTDDFLQAVADNKDFKLSFTREETGEKIEKIVKASDIFDKFAYMNWDYAEPAFLFWDRIKSYNLVGNNEEFEYAGVNPCVSGDTLILTNQGYKEIKTLINQPTVIWNGYQWSEVVPKITGYNQPMKKVTLSDGVVLNCTDYHKFILRDNNRVMAKDLNIGDELVKCSFPVIDCGEDIDEKLAYSQGFFTGDGYKHNNTPFIYLYGNKKSLLPYIINEDVTIREEPLYDGNNRISVTINRYNKARNKFNKDFVPSVEYSIKSRLDWLSGYLDSDGTILSKDGGIGITSVDKDRLMRVKLMLNTLGVNPTLNKERDSGLRSMPDSHGQSKEYKCQSTYRLVISAYKVKKLIDLGLNTHRIKPIVQPNRDASRFISVINIEDGEIEPIVYCFNESKNHSGIFNGVITAQCAEEPLPAGGSCLLGAINLAEFVQNPFTNNAYFNFLDFEDAIKTSVNALNEVLDEGLPLHPLKIQRETVRDWRQIGLGIMGLADMLIKLGVTYGSNESLSLCDEIGKTLALYAISASSSLGKEYGSYPRFNPDKVKESEFYQAHAKGFGLSALRNSQLLTIAPTGTISTMLGVSGGIEPIFANYYTRKTESLHGEDVYYKIFTPIAWEYLQSHGYEEDESKLPEYFVVSQDIPYHKRIDMQAVWQKHIDASISSTVNLPNSATVDDIKNLYMYAWKKGLKGITVYRDGCKRSGILITNDSVTDETKEQTKLSRGTILSVSDDLIGAKRKLNTGCGSIHFETYFDELSGEPMETFINVGSSGSCERNLQLISRLMSLALRAGVSVEDIIDQCKSIKPCTAYVTRTNKKHDTSKGSSCPSAIGYALEDLYSKIKERCFADFDLDEYEDIDTTPVKETPNSFPTFGTCPECGEPLVNEGGCNVCKACGYSKCD